MKFKLLTLFITICFILTGLIILFFLEQGAEENFKKNIENKQLTSQEDYQEESISKVTIALLFIIGLLGFIGMSRKKK